MLSVFALQDMLAYSAWASRRMVEAAAQLSPDQLTRDFGTADKSVLGTLVHIFAADRIWLRRIEGHLPEKFIGEEDYRLSVLQNDWPALQDKWRAWAAGLEDEAAAADLHYRDIRGNQWTQPIWQVVLHVVNHGTHHRGQVQGFLRAMGASPAPLDLTAYYRTRAKIAG
jgi:uncharacterized damage-inducible protein DinB